MFGFDIPGLLSSIIDLVKASIEFLAPLFAMAIAFLSWYFDKFQKAAAVIATNLITLFAIVPLLVGTGAYTHYQTAKKCEVTTIKKLRKDYKFVPHKKVEKSSYGFDFTNPFGWGK
jgi:fumarate reductase subunit C